METQKGKISRLQRQQADINYAKRIAKKILIYNSYKESILGSLYYKSIKRLAKCFLKEIEKR